MILAHSEGEIGVFGVAGVVMDNYALEVVILAHSAPISGCFALIIFAGDLVELYDHYGSPVADLSHSLIWS